MDRSKIPATVALTIAVEATRHVDPTLPLGERVEVARAFSDAAHAGYVDKAHVASPDSPVHAMSEGYALGVRLRRDSEADTRALLDYGAAMARLEARRLGVEVPS